MIRASIWFSVRIIYLSLHLTHLWVVDVLSIGLVRILVILRVLALMEVNLVCLVSELVTLISSMICWWNTSLLIIARINSPLNECLLLLVHLLFLVNLLNFILKELIQSVSFLSVWNQFRILNHSIEDFSPPSWLQLIIIDFMKTSNNSIN